MNLLTLVFLAGLAAGAALQLWLGWRNMAHVRAHRSHVPEVFRDDVPLAQHQKAADYTLANGRLAAAAVVANGLVLAGLSLGGGLVLLDRAWRDLALTPLATGLGVVISAGLIMAVLRSAFSAYRVFVVEQRFGFNRASPALFMVDTAKRGLIAMAIAVPLGGLVLWLMAAAGPLWWLWVWALWTGFLIVRTWAYPGFIAPLFNSFTPLRDSVLKARIEGLAARCGFAVGDIQVMDASRRSGHGNAYFAGLGASKRVVLYDTLLEALEAGEIEAVLAHELGHYRRRHAGKHLALVSLVRLAGLALLAWLVPQPWFYAGLGMDPPSNHAAIALFAILVSAFWIFLRPLGAMVLREFEFEADAFAAAHGNGRTLIPALIKLHRNNATSLTPEPLYSTFFHSHPPLAARMRHLSGADGTPAG